MYCRIIVFMCTLLIAIGAMAQKTGGDIKRGDACMKMGTYDKAAAFYKKAADGNINDVSAKEKLGKALLESGDLQSAEAVYKLLAESPMAADINKFYYGQVLRMNGKYEVAAAAYQSYFDGHPNDPLAAEFKDFLNRVTPLLTDHKVYTVTNIPENSAGSDVGPTFCLYTFCFSSNGHSSRKSNYDLYMLHGGNASNPASPQKLKGNVNKQLDEGAAAFSHNGKEMIFTRSNYGHKGTDHVMHLGLYHAEYDTTAQAWKNIMLLPFVDYSYNYMQPSLSKDGSRLFFASDMKGGLGETDIYMSTRQGNTWSAPVNLGSGVNTIGKEETPFIADDGTLYFASDSRLGLGGLDIYAAMLTDTVWGRAQNAGVPLNSAYNDFGYVSDSTGRSGYIVSNRPGGMGGNDIYHFAMNNSSACGILIDAKTQKLVSGATVTLLGNDGTQRDTKSSDGGDFCFDRAGDGQLEVSKTGYERYNGPLNSTGGARQIIMLQPQATIDLTINVSQQSRHSVEGATTLLQNTGTGAVSEQKSDSDGIVHLALEPNQEYVLKVSKTDDKGSYEKFVRPISTLGLKAGQRITENAQLIYHPGVIATSTVASNSSGPSIANADPADVSSGRDLPTVYFDLGSYNLNLNAKIALNKIAAYMLAAPGAQVEISSNTDASGSLQANMKLSAKRALSCLNYLVEKGVDKSRFIAVGYGASKLVSNCINCTEAQQALNRRTEFKILKQ